MVYGATDEFGARAIENKVHVHDLHATILWLLGFDHDEADLPLQRPRFPPDGCLRECRERHHGVSVSGHFRLRRIQSNDVCARLLVLALALMAGAALRPPTAKLTPDATRFFRETRSGPSWSEIATSATAMKARRSRAACCWTRATAFKGGDTGPAIVPGDPEKSLLIKAVRYTDKDLQMPPNDRQLAANQIRDLETWVKMGAPDPRTDAGGQRTNTPWISTRPGSTGPSSPSPTRRAATGGSRPLGADAGG